MSDLSASSDNSIEAHDANKPSSNVVGWGAPASFGIGLLSYIAPQFVLGFVLAIMVIVLDTSIETILEDSSTTTVLAISAFISVIGALIIWAYTKGKGGWRALGFVKPEAKYIVYILPVYIAYFVALIAALFAADALIASFDLDQEQELGFDEVRTTIDYVATFITLVVIAPLFEELLFRGFMFRGVAQRLGFWPAALSISALFAVAHGQLNVGVDTFILGIAASWLVWKSNSLVPAILLHALKNAIAYITLFIVT